MNPSILPLLMCLEIYNCCIYGKLCRPWSDATFCCILLVRMGCPIIVQHLIRVYLVCLGLSVWIFCSIWFESTPFPYSCLSAYTAASSLGIYCLLRPIGIFSGIWSGSTPFLVCPDTLQHLIWVYTVSLGLSVKFSAASDLDLHCFLRLVCLNTLQHLIWVYTISLGLSVQIHSSIWSRSTQFP